jgi:hypothetical protein
MGYLNGNCSLYLADGRPKKLYDLGFLSSGTEMPVTSTEKRMVKAKLSVIGYGNPLTAFRLRILDGARANQEVNFKCQDVAFINSLGIAKPLREGEKFLGFYKHPGNGHMIQSEVLVVKVTPDVTEGYCYSVTGGVCAVGCGLSPVFLFAQFEE